MSLTRDGVWEGGVWAPTVWAAGVWYEPAPEAWVPNGGGGAFMLHGAGKKREKKDDSIEQALIAAFDAFNDAPAEVQEKVTKALGNAATKRAGFVAVDLSDIVERVGLVKRLFDLHAQLERQLFEEDEQDVHFLLLH